jgi:hypothetical protein
MRRFFASSLALIAPTLALAVPTQIAQQGRLLDSGGAPIEGAHSVEFTLYDAASGGAEVWSETANVNFTGGYYAWLLGSTTPIDSADLDISELYLGIALDSAPELSPRLRVASVPYALLSDTASNVQGGVVDASELRINGTTIVDGSGALQVGVDFADINGLPSSLTDGDDDTLGALGCASGEIIRFDGSSWACASVAFDASAITSGTLDIGRLPIGNGANQVKAGDAPDADTLGGLGCAAGQVARVNGSGAWACEDFANAARGALTSGAVNLASGSQVNGVAIATTATVAAAAGSGLCGRMSTVAARTYTTLDGQLDADWTGAGVCGTGKHVCNFQEYTVYSIMGSCSIDSAWIVGGFSNIASHRRSIWNGQDSVQCQGSNGLATYGKWGPYHGRVHCEGASASKPVLCCANQ